MNVRIFADWSRISQGNIRGRKMQNAVIPDWNRFTAYLAAQPLCAWARQKQEKVAAGLLDGPGGSASIHPPPKKNDNADLAAALSSMA